VPVPTRSTFVRSDSDPVNEVICVAALNERTPALNLTVPFFSNLRPNVSTWQPGTRPPYVARRSAYANSTVNAFTSSAAFAGVNAHDLSAEPPVPVSPPLTADESQNARSSYVASPGEREAVALDARVDPEVRAVGVAELLGHDVADRLVVHPLREVQDASRRGRGALRGLDGRPGTRERLEGHSLLLGRFRQF
jgi:hypothetical protein